MGPKDIPNIDKNVVSEENQVQSTEVIGQETHIVDEWDNHIGDITSF
jgi:hypothetical protein